MNRGRRSQRCSIGQIGWFLRVSSYDQAKYANNCRDANKTNLGYGRKGEASCRDDVEHKLGPDRPCNRHQIVLGKNKFVGERNHSNNIIHDVFNRNCIAFCGCTVHAQKRTR